MKIRTLMAAGATTFALIAAPAMAAQGQEAPKQSVGEYASDAVITTKVKAALLAEKSVSGFDISVETVDGVVHLKGDVDNAAQAELAERIARGVDGVKQVNNDLKAKSAS